MSRMLNLADRLLERGRRYQDLGLHQNALTILGHVAGLKELPPALIEETQVRLAEIFLGRRQYSKARRRLTAALVQSPQNPRYNFLMGEALNSDPREDASKAAEFYRQSLLADPDQPQCLGQYGLLALRLGLTEEGLNNLRRAFEKEPNDPEVVARLAKGLQEVERPEEARSVLLAAMFRNSRDARFRQLWNDFQFQNLHTKQQTSRGNDANEEEESQPRLLPFVRPNPDSAPSPKGKKRIRHDGPAMFPPPHLPGSSGVPGRKHA